MSTGHANGTEDMLNRLATMVLMGIDLPLAAIKQQIASGIDILIHLGRLRDKTRKVLEIAEVDGVREGNICLHTLYKFEEGERSKKNHVIGKLEKKGELRNGEKLKSAGITV